MKKIFSLFLLMTALTLSAQTVQPTWESLNQRPYPQWFSDAKLGIFIHWGLYSVPAYASLEGYGEWYLKGLMTGDTTRLNFQNRVFGDGKNDFQYRDFTRYFKAEMFNPDEWAELFQQSGARYVLLVTKHHDGYCLWDSKLQPEWNSTMSGPQRNIVAELTEAVRAKGLKMGFYYSLLEWNNPMHRWTVDPADSITPYVENYMVPQFKELVTRYKPSVVFADGDWDNTAEQLHSADLIAWYYNTVGPEAIVNNRWGHHNDHGFRTPEYSAGITMTDRPWAECRGLGRSFGLNRNEPLSNYLTSDELIRHFVKLVAAGGGMTLNVGPAADGQIPLLQQERLLDLGKWLKINGEAIYGTRPYFIENQPHFYNERKITIHQTSGNIDFDWKRNSPHPSIAYDHFTAEWTGKIRTDFTEEYTFEVETDDAMRVTIDNQTIIDYNPNDPTSAKMGKINIAQDTPHDIQVFFEEDDMEAVARLWWSSPSQHREVIPTSSFAGDLKTTYTSMQPYVCYTTKSNVLYAIALEYPQDVLALPAPQPDHKLKISLLGCDKVLPYKYKNGLLTIDTRSLQYADLKSTAAWVFKIE